MNAKPYVSILVPTYKRAHLIGYVLDALKKQSYSNFEVLIILKPSGDGTEQVLKDYENSLSLDIIKQEEGYVTDALNLGLGRVKGDIIVFLDDDAVPNEDWLQNHVDTYFNKKVDGVAGNVVPARLIEGKLFPKAGPSEIIPQHNGFSNSLVHTIVDRPIKGLEDYMVYISRAGRVQYNSVPPIHEVNHFANSLLGMGANMSLLTETVQGFSFPRTWILGISWEQYIGWWVWNRGHHLVFNPSAVVNHIVHGNTLSRFGKNFKKETLSTVEGNLLYYRIKNSEPSVSVMYRIVWLLFQQMDNAKKLCFDHETTRIAGILGTFLSEIIGLKWGLSRRLGGKYAPISDLERIFKNS